MHDCIKCLQR